MPSNLNVFLKKYKYYIYIVLAIVWMVIIYVNSSFEGGTSSKLSEILVNLIFSVSGWFGKIPGIENIQELIKSDGFHMFVRKTGHFAEFGILGLFVFAGLGIVKNIRLKPFKRFFIGLIICALYAVSDEVHQLFVSGRVFAFTDIFIDFSGSFFSIGAVLLIFRKRWVTNG